MPAPLLIYKGGKAQRIPPFDSLRPAFRRAAPEFFQGVGERRRHRRQVFPAPLGLPGRLMIRVRPRIAGRRPGEHGRGGSTAKDAANRMASGMPGTRRSGPRSRVASGVTSLGRRPVPPGGQDQVQAVVIAPGRQLGRNGLGLIGHDLCGGNLKAAGVEGGPVQARRCRPAPRRGPCH